LRILLTNDDGIHGEGFQVIKKVLEKENEVWSVVPNVNRSGCSHGLTMYTPLTLKRKDDTLFTCSGSPVDCCIYGMQAVMTEKPDVIISGINKGANMGTDLLYSGTAAAARQGALLNIPSIAVSLCKDEKMEKIIWKYDALANFVNNNLMSLVAMCEDNIFININAKSAEKYLGIRFTELSKRTYNDKVEVYKVKDGLSYSFFVCGNVTSEGSEKADFRAVEEGYISISRVHAQPLAVDCHEFENLSFIV